MQRSNCLYLAIVNKNHNVSYDGDDSDFRYALIFSQVFIVSLVFQRSTLRWYIVLL